MGNDETRRDEALNCLQTDCGLNALIPRFAVTIAEGVRCNIVGHNMAILIYLMRIIQALSSNPNVSLERCLHDIIPSVMSCILSRRITLNIQSESQWKLRVFSSQLLALIVKTYNNRIPNIFSRITLALSRPFYDTNCSMTTLYGALYAIRELGFEAIRSVLIPKVPSIYNTLQRAESNKNLPFERTHVDKVYSFLTETLVNFATKDQRCATELKTLEDFCTSFGGFGEEVYNACKTTATNTSNHNNNSSNNNIWVDRAL